MCIYNLRSKMRKDSNLEMNLDWTEEERGVLNVAGTPQI